MKRTLPVILAAVLALTACANDSTRTPLPPASTPSAAPAITAAPVRDAHRVIDLHAADVAPRLSWSPDSRYLALDSRESFTVWDVDADPPTLVIEKPEFTAVFTSEFSPDGRLISLADCPESLITGCIVKIWDWQADEVIAELTLPEDYDLAWSPEGDLLAMWAGDRDTIIFWADPTSGEQAPEDIDLPPDLLAANLVWLPNGTLRMLTLQIGGITGVWNSSSASVINPYPASGSIGSHEEVLSTDGSRAVTPNSSGDIEVWDAADGTRIQLITFPRVSANYLALNADGSLVAAASFDDTTIKVFDVASGGLIATLPDSGSVFMYDLLFSPDSRTFASSYGNGEVHLWDLPSVQTAAATVTPIPTYTPHPTLAAASPELVSFPAPLPEWNQANMQLSSDAEWVDNQTLRVKYVEYSVDYSTETFYALDVDIASQSRVALREATEAEMYPYDLSPDGTRYVHSERDRDDNSVRSTVIDVQSGETLYELPYDPYGQDSLRWSPDQRYIYIVKEFVVTGAIEIYDGQDGTYIGSLPDPVADAERIYDYLVISPDGKWGASITHTPEMAAVIWDLQSRQIAYTLPNLDAMEFGHKSRLRWSDDSSRLVLVWWKGVQVLDIASWQIERTFQPEINGDPIAFHDGFVYWSPDGEWLVHGAYIALKGYDSLIYAWNINTGEQRVLMRYEGATSDVNWRFVWHPERDLFATIGADGRVYIAGMDSAMLHFPTDITYLPRWMGWSPDGRKLAALTEGGTIYVWTFDGLP